MIECGLLRLLLLLNNSRVGVACDAASDHGDKKTESSANYRNLIYTKTQTAACSSISSSACTQTPKISLLTFLLLLLL
jgi:hypothetical protein